MSHQDWDPIIFTKQPVVVKKNIPQISKKQEGEDYKLENKKIGSLILQARTTKKDTQESLAQKLGINKNILKRWETNLELPTNNDIAKISKILNIQLPRNKKLNIKEKEK